MSFIDKIKGFFGGSGLEGSWRGPFSGIGHLGNRFILGSLEDGWQKGLSSPYSDHTKVAIVYACVQAYSRAVSTCVMSHMRDDDGRQNAITDSWTSRLIINPNDHETWNQHIYNTVAELGFHGSSLDVIVRDNRNVPIGLHRIPFGNWTLHIEPETKAVFYGAHGESDSLVPIQDYEFLIPARDVIHYRQHCPRHPLLGESPISAAALAVGINVALTQSQAAFFNQMRRPSGILSTEQALNKEQIIRLRDAFDEQSKRWANGGMPILSNGLKFQPMSITSQDAQLIEAQNLSMHDIARVYATPPPIVGILDNATFNNSETLLSFWLATGLGSILENLEQTLNKAFGFNTNTNGDYINFNTQSLLRSDAKSLMETLTKGIVGGVYTPNEARGKVDLPEIEGGDQVFLQMQNMPINILTEYALGQVAAQRLNSQAAIQADNNSNTPVDTSSDSNDNLEDDSNPSIDSTGSTEEKPAKKSAGIKPDFIDETKPFDFVDDEDFDPESVNKLIENMMAKAISQPEEKLK